jgi:phospholipid/cholesterol/gamma-HCH transport system substrate-binding protein
MDLRFGKEAVVGTLVIIAIAIFVLGTMWLSGRSIGNRDAYRIQFPNVSGLKRASPVTVSGVQVGRVEEITLQEVGKVMVKVSLPPHIQPRLDASAAVLSSNLVGDYVVEFDPGRAAQPLPQGQVIVGRAKSGFTDRAEVLSDRADSVLIGLQEFANKETAQQLRETMTALQGTLQAAERTMRLYGDASRGPSAELTRTMSSFRALSARLDSTLANPGLQTALGRSDSVTHSLNRMTSQLAVTTARLDTVLAGVNAGRGTIGKFATDSGLYYDLRDVSAGLKGLLAELQKNPGKIGVTVKVF